ncbi:hypothetical protein GCM10020254_12340 [Streptomyces goshikiensis]
MPHHEGLLREQVRVGRGPRVRPGGQQRGHGVAAVGDLGGQLVVGDPGVPQQFVRDHLDQLGPAERVPALRRQQFGVRGAAPAAHPEQPPAATQPVDAGLAGRLGRLPEQAVQQGSRGVRVGGGVEVRRFHSIHSVIITDHRVKQ